ncbi:Bro-N domain-containing protein, partial [Escherichia coli]|nr:antirepressor protein [Escherichia coli]
MNKNIAATGKGDARHVKKFCDIRDLVVLRFDSVNVRVVYLNGDPWFVGADVCAALEISNVTDAVSVLDSDEVMTLALTEGHSGKRGGARSWNVVSESG